MSDKPWTAINNKEHVDGTLADKVSRDEVSTGQSVAGQSVAGRSVHWTKCRGQSIAGRSVAGQSVIAPSMKSLDFLYTNRAKQTDDLKKKQCPRQKTPNDNLK